MANGLDATLRAPRLAFTIVLLLVASVHASDTAGVANADAPHVRWDSLTISGLEFAAGALEGAIVTADGVTLSGTYTSPPIAAPFPFTDVGPQWIMDWPIGANYGLELRTSLDGQAWSGWVGVEGEPDWRRPDARGIPEWVGDLVPVPQSTRWHRYAQYRWRPDRAPGGSAPLLHRMVLSFIDAGITPQARAAHHPTGEPPPALSLDSFPKPAVVSRTAWGCPDGQESPDWEPEYEPVTHAIVHHTVTPNDDTDFAARVRSIWVYHARSRGWGDIGYNYLVDREGTVYEGRAGGDNSVGGHAYPGNHGSLGLAFMGAFSSDPVPQSMLDGAADLIAWEAGRKSIDPYGWGWLRSSDPDNTADRWVPRIAGHRDVWYTACPGDVLYGHLPMLRDEVASLLDSSNYLLVDELDAELSSDANWYDGPGGCGYREHAYWTLSTTSPDLSTNQGWWRPDLPQAGLYRVYAFVPYCITGHGDSDGVTYRVHHAGGATTIVAVNQAAAAGGWVELGSFDFDAGTEGAVSLDDIAVDEGKTIWFDAIKWYRKDGEEEGIQPPENSKPADTSWSTSRVVVFGWSKSSSPEVDHYRLRIAVGPDLADPLKTDYVDPSEPEYSYHFGDDHRQLYWGVEAHSPLGYSPPSGPWQLGVDTVPPTCQVNGVLAFPDGHFAPGWTGDDATSGISTFDLDYRLDSSTEWTSWITETTALSARWQPAGTGAVWFRCRAADAAGNVGTFDGGGVSTDGAILVDRQVYLPLVTRNSPHS